MQDHFPSPMPLFVLTAKGLEEILQEEIQEVLEKEGLTFQALRVVRPGCVGLLADWSALVILNLLLRTASRVLVSVGHGKVRGLEDVYKCALQIPWEDFFKTENTFSVISSVTDSRMRNPLMVNLKIKDAVADRFRSKIGQRPSVDKVHPQVGIYARVHQNYLEISLDSTGKSLSHRGYREKSHMAPLREPLAAALLRLSGWNKVVDAIYSGNSATIYYERIKNENEEGGRRRLPARVPLIPTFYDPMCGTGTLPIEAALILKRKYPALERSSFPFLHYLPAQKAQIQNIFNFLREKYLKMEGRSGEIRPLVKNYLEKAGLDNNYSELIFGSDCDRQAIAASLQNARSAGVEGLVRFKIQAIDELQDQDSPRKGGIMIVNPPYGERLEAPDARISQIYENLGHLWKRKFPGWLTWILSSNEEALKKVGLRATKKYFIYNGPMKCRLQQYLIV